MVVNKKRYKQLVYSALVSFDDLIVELQGVEPDCFLFENQYYINCKNATSPELSPFKNEPHSLIKLQTVVSNNLFFLILLLMFG